MLGSSSHFIRRLDIIAAINVQSISIQSSLFRNPSFCSSALAKIYGNPSLQVNPTPIHTPVWCIGTNSRIPLRWISTSREFTSTVIHIITKGISNSIWLTFPFVSNLATLLGFITASPEWHRLYLHGRITSLRRAVLEQTTDRRPVSRVSPSGPLIIRRFFWTEECYGRI